MVNGDLLDEDYYISSFMSGLTPKLKTAVKMMKPTSLQAVIELGRDQLDTIEAITSKVKLSNKFFGNGSGVNTSRNPLRSPTKPPNSPRPHV